MDYIKIKGAKENNLKNVSLDIPRDKLVVFTGLSGSGEYTLAFDTICAGFELLAQSYPENISYEIRGKI